MFTWHHVGAHLLQCSLNGQSLFYLSPMISQFADRPPRGGVPVMFPQFAERGPGPKHGLVRMRDWQPLAPQGGSVQAFTLVVPPEPAQHWLGHARLTVSANVSESTVDATQAACTLQIEFVVENIGPDAFSFSGGLHPYYALGDARTLRIEGLDGVPFEDRYGASQALSSPFLQGQAFERLYHSATAIDVFDGARRFRLSASGFDNWMVWNPGVELARGLADLPDDDWQRFVCIEPVLAAVPVSLGPGERFVGVMRVG